MDDIEASEEELALTGPVPRPIIARNMKQRSTNERNGAASGTRAVERALAVLHAVGETRAAPGLAELSLQLGLHKTTVFRLLGALERAGFVLRDEVRQSYELGPTLVQLGAQARRSVGLSDAARPELDALARETGETATLEVLVGREVLILEEVHGHFLIGSRPEVGTRWPAHVTSTGKVLLAAQPRSRRALGRLSRHGPASITSRAALDRALSAARAQGFAIAHEELESGFVAIAAPVRGASGDVVAAISIGGPTSRITTTRLRHFTSLVRDAAGRISAQLGERRAFSPGVPPPVSHPHRVPAS
jgi:DNA-binding IclR family transcriptional regulator